jgi:hypothetical protein
MTSESLAHTMNAVLGLVGNLDDVSPLLLASSPPLTLAHRYSTWLSSGA